MSVAEKKSEILICIDHRPLNEALKREHYKLPTLEDVPPELSKAKVFSVCDLKSGYLHCELDHSSSFLATFATPFGRYGWLRLPFVLKVSMQWDLPKTATSGSWRPWGSLLHPWCCDHLGSNRWRTWCTIPYLSQVLCRWGYYLEQREVSFWPQRNYVYGPCANKWRPQARPL